MFIISGFLKVANDLEWGAPSFAQHKNKSNRVRFISDFRNINKQLNWKPYPMPKINEILLNWEGFQYATALDLNMGSYHILLSKNASKWCKMILPWGKYRYKRLPMGVANLPEIFQQKMSDLFNGFEFICAYIDDILILIKGDWIDYVQKLELTLNKLKEKGLKRDIENYFFRKTEMEYLGLWVTRNGFKPINKKIEAITNMKPPTSQK